MAVRRWPGDTLTEPQLLETLCEDAGIPFIAESGLQPQADAIALIPSDVARMHCVVPLAIESRHFVLAMADPFDLAAIRALTRTAGRSIRVVGAERGAVLRALDRAYGVGRARDVPDGATAGPDLGAAAAVDDVIRRAIEIAATDIHIEPAEDALHVRFRVDGLLTDGPAFPKAAQAALISRVKVLSGLDIADARLPQDGRARLNVGGRAVDLRVSAFPTLHGEDIVLRILDRDRVTLELEKLGVEPDDLTLLRSALRRPNGLIPVTGPTGSGKTTTLYAALSELNAGERAIVTLEDPVEFEIARVRQAQVNARAGLTFANGLRSILRHDPDVILVGEIRDADTMQIALSASLTGHLVLTTLNTTTAAGTIPRLLDMGAEPFLIASAVTMFVSQRLVRVLCPECKTRADMPTAVRRRFEIGDATLFAARGCGRCRGTGYRGRMAIFELLPMSPDVVSHIAQRTAPDKIMMESGRPTLLQDGLRKVRAGVTTLDEILRVTT